MAFCIGEAVLPKQQIISYTINILAYLMAKETLQPFAVLRFFKLSTHVAKLISARSLWCPTCLG